MESRLRIELFGGLRLVYPDGRVEHCRAHKPMALLAFLAFHHRRAHAREALIEQFWPDDELDTARHKLSVALSQLRAQLGASSNGSMIAADRSTVRLEAGEVETDVLAFEQALQRVSQAGTDAERCAHLSAAVELYQGELLSGFYDAWVFPEQQRLAEQFLQAIRRLVALREQADARGELIPIALRGIAADPFSEALHAEAMRLQLDAGQPAAALRLFRTLEHRLQEDLGVVPSRSVLALAKAAQQQLAALRDGAKSGSEAGLGGGEGVAIPQTAGAPATSGYEPPGGAVPLGSPFYVERAVDSEFHTALERGDSIVLVKGPRQVGKTSLLARGLERARGRGRAALTDFQGFNASHLESPDRLLLSIAEGLAEELDLEDPRDHWEASRGANPNFRRYMRRCVLAPEAPPLVWALDEVDRLFSCDFGSDLFGMFRSWHNERALNPSGPWSRLTMVLTYATEAQLFITDLNQSPFNVGTRLKLDDFTLAQVADLNARHGSPLSGPEEVRQFFACVGGHPYLVRCGLYELTRAGRTVGSLAELDACAATDDGTFDSHLRRILLLLGRDPELCASLREVLRGRPCPDPGHFYRLRSAGVLAGESAPSAVLRCRLYADYLTPRLL